MMNFQNCVKLGQFGKNVYTILKQTSEASVDNLGNAHCAVHILLFFKCFSQTGNRLNSFHCGKIASVTGTLCRLVVRKESIASVLSVMIAKC